MDRMEKTRRRAARGTTLAVLLLVSASAMVRMGIAAEPLPAAARVDNVMDYGAKGDGVTDDTKAVQTAIDTCSAKGAKLVFPAGTFMTGTVYLRSNTAIELTAKAVWKGIGRVDVYPVQHPTKVRMTWRALIFADDVENISISGPGMIHGNGENPVFPKKPDHRDRPFGIWITGSRNIRIEGIQLRSPAYWTQHYEGCDHLRISGIRVFSHANMNNDGLDVTDCHDVIISDSEIDSDDNALCLKSHGERGVSDVVISNCQIASHAAVFKFGTASRGGFRRITANNLVIRPSAADHIEHPAQVKGGLGGIDLACTDGGTLEDLVIQNVVMEGVETPFVIKLGDRWDRGRGSAKADAKFSKPGATAKKAGAKAGKVGEVADKGDSSEGRAGVVRNIIISHVVARHAGPIPSLMTGYPGHSVENITLSDMMIEIEGGHPMCDLAVRENSGNYPCNRIFGREIPAYAFFVRHAKNVELRNIQVKTIAADQRPAMIFDDATATLENVDLANQGGPAGAPIWADKADAVERRGSSRGLTLEVHSK